MRARSTSNLSTPNPQPTLQSHNYIEYQSLSSMKVPLKHATEPQTLIKNGVRSVSPYYFEYKTPFKERWRGLLAAHVLQAELGQTESAVRSSVDSGRIYVTGNNGRSGEISVIWGASVFTYTLRNHDIIHNLQHCHEPNVRVHRDSFLQERSHGKALKNEENRENLEGTVEYKAIYSTLEAILRLNGAFNGMSLVWPVDQETPKGHVTPTPTTPFTRLQPGVSSSGIEILYEDDSLVIVNKPGGVPTHPGGIYRYNTMSEILAHDLQSQVWPCHRLDKCTLGIMVFAKTKQANSTFLGLFQAKENVEKWYLARVKGCFPLESCRYRCPVFSINSAGKAYFNISHLGQVPTDSATDFYKVHYWADSDTTLVLCRPLSGRMHQIRIHLRNLGFPIANDALYTGEGDVNKMKNEVELRVYQELWRRFPRFSRPIGPGTPGGAPNPEVIEPEINLPPPSKITMSEFMTPKIEAQMNLLSELRANQDKRAISGVCGECSRPLYEENCNPDLGIWLHAVALGWREPRAQGLFSVAAPLPSWSV